MYSPSVLLKTAISAQTKMGLLVIYVEKDTSMIHQLNNANNVVLLDAPNAHLTLFVEHVFEVDLPQIVMTSQVALLSGIKSYTRYNAENVYKTVIYVTNLNVFCAFHNTFSTVYYVKGVWIIVRDVIKMGVKFVSLDICIIQNQESVKS